MSVTVTETDNSARCIDALSDAVEEALGLIGDKAVEYAKGTVPVRTGNLRDSIDSTVTNEGGMQSAVIFVDYDRADYGEYVELGTSRQAAQPYLRPSVMDHTSEYMQMLTQTVGKALG